MAAKVVSFINLKGGVGKTTLALAIGEVLAFGEGMGQNVLMVDIDAQYNLSSSLLPLEKLKELWKEKNQYIICLKPNSMEEVGMLMKQL